MNLRANSGPLSQGAKPAEKGREMIDRTVKELRAAHTLWSRTTIVDRLKIISAFRRHAANQPMLLAQPLLDEGFRSAGEILSAEVLPLLDACRFLERQARDILRPRKTSAWDRPLWLTGANAEVRREPYGLVLIVAPSNYPVFIPGVQLLQALVAGNVVLLKPGGNGTRAAEALRDLLRYCGLPNFVFEVLPETTASVTGALQAGIDKLVFTGSAEVGTKLSSLAAPTATATTMELSGCDSAILCSDTDVELAARAIAFGLCLNSGQTCIAPRRVFVSRAIATEFEGRLAENLALRPPMRLSAEACEKLLPELQSAISAGAHLLSGKIDTNGNISGPVAVAGVPAESRLLEHDIFGPVLSIVIVADDSEAVALANDSRYALGATVFSKSRKRSLDIARSVVSGVVVINDMIAPTADPRLPFGGTKLSGFGVTRGPEGLLEMTRPKVFIRRGSNRHAHLDSGAINRSALFLNYIKAAHGTGLAARVGAVYKLIREMFQKP